MTRSTTIADVASRAGVSQATVSRVLNDGHTGAPDIRERVARAVEELDYRPSTSARRLAKRRGGGGDSVQFVMHPTQDLGTYYGDILRGVEEEARRSRYTVYFSSAMHNLGILGDETPPTDLMGRGARGVIYAGDVTKEFLEPVQREGTPTVVINSCLPDGDVDCVMCDNFAATHRVVQWLAGLGHRRIACLDAGGSRNSSVAERVMGYRQGLLDAGIPYDPALLVSTRGFTVPEGQEAMAPLLGESSRPTAVFGTADEVAVGAMQAVRQAGLSVPQDVSIVGINDLPMAQTCRPALTTLRIFRHEMGHEAVQRLLELIRDPKQRPRRIDVSCELVERESVAEVRGTR